MLISVNVLQLKQRLISNNLSAIKSANISKIIQVMKMQNKNYLTMDSTKKLLSVQMYFIGEEGLNNDN